MVTYIQIIVMEEKKIKFQEKAMEIQNKYDFFFRDAREQSIDKYYAIVWNNNITGLLFEPDLPLSIREELDAALKEIFAG